MQQFHRRDRITHEIGKDVLAERQALGEDLEDLRRQREHLVAVLHHGDLEHLFWYFGPVVRPVQVGSEHGLVGLYVPANAECFFLVRFLPGFKGLRAQDLISSPRERVLGQLHFLLLGQGEESLRAVKGFTLEG